MFNEKLKEYDKEQNTELPVWQSPKYLESKKKAIEIINSKKYDLTEADFWILMNRTGDKKKMAYTGLIISHNGCLKINDKFENKDKFVPSCVKRTDDGHNQSLVYEYSNDGQGIFEVGEVSAKNCKNDYHYAMAFKRLFDRVVLKISKLAYAGIYSDSEADEFKEPIEEREVEEFDISKYEKELTELKIDLKKVAIAYKTTLSELTDEIVQGAIKRKRELLEKDKENGK